MTIGFRRLAWIWTIAITFIMTAFVIDTGDTSWIGVIVLWTMFNSPAIVTFCFTGFMGKQKC